MTTNYATLDKQLSGLLADENDLLAMSVNMVALLFAEIPDINWLGLYLLRNNELRLGPFQGNPACVKISIGSGVCGTAVSEARTLRVDDVHKFAGHIACDVASRSEIVIPLQHDGRIFAALDVDSPRPARFSAQDQEGLEKICRTFVTALAALQADLTQYI